MIRSKQSITKAIINKYGIYIICTLFFVLYTTLSVVRHDHFLSAWDLSVVDQVMWKYSRFLLPITTIHAYANTLILTDHIEFIYLLLSPLYWIWNDVRMLIIAQAFFISFSAIPIFWLARKKGLVLFLSLALSTSYLMFYGIQTAIWNDVHSIVFGAALLPWFIYFLHQKNTRWTIVFFILTILCKEDLAFLTFVISFIYFLKRRDRLTISLMILSAVYLFSIFYVYYPHFTHDGYRFENKSGFFSHLSPVNFVDTIAKRDTITYSLLWFGLLPIFAPLYLLVAFADISHYFIFGSSVETAQGIVLHYRVTLAPLLALPTIFTLAKYKKLNTNFTAIYLLFFALVIQYQLHLPLSYLAKSWFWHNPASVTSIEKVLTYLPKDASVVSEVNIIPHIAHRKMIYTLWADTKTFKNISLCGKSTCPWFHWDGKPTYLIADTSRDWDIRQLFQNNPQFNEALLTMTKSGVIKEYKRSGSTILYKVIKNPKD